MESYNAIPAFISKGYLFAFRLAEVQKFSVWAFWANDNTPGEAWAYESHCSLYKVCLTMHIIVVIPAGLLATLQFIPNIRYKLFIFHRLNGCIVMLLMLLLSITGIIISKVSFGGDFATQVFAGFFGIVVMLSMALAYMNINRSFFT